MSKSHRRKVPVPTPSRVLAEILVKPDIVDKLAQYGSGDQKVLADLLPFIGHLDSRIPRILGYWLWDSVLRFPGIIVNTVAAASYLDIAPETFVDLRIQKLGKKALYNGPFADEKAPLWKVDLRLIPYLVCPVDSIV